MMVLARDEIKKSFAPVSSEFAKFKLCGKRLKKRLTKTVATAARLPEASLPKQSGSVDDQAEMRKAGQTRDTQTVVVGFTLPQKIEKTE